MLLHYHSVDGWYLFTSEDHYRVHNCYGKSTRSEQLTDTVHLHHKNITNPQVSHADKVMAAISDCSKAIKGMTATENDPNMRQLQQLVRLTTQAARDNPDLLTATTYQFRGYLQQMATTKIDALRDRWLQRRNLFRGLLPQSQVF